MRWRSESIVRVLGRLALTAVATCMLCAPVFRSAHADGFPEPESDFRADLEMRMNAGGRENFTVRGREFYSGGKRRREMSVMGRQAVHIERPEKGVSWALIPEMKRYIEVKEGAADASGNEMPDPMAGAKDVEIERIGSETVNGISAEKYRVRFKDGNGTAWMTQDKIPVRFKGRAESDGQAYDFQMDYSNIERGKQAASLFEIPSDYSSMPGMGAFPGQTHGGAAREKGPDGTREYRHGQRTQDQEREIRETIDRLRREMERQPPHGR